MLFHLFYDEHSPGDVGTFYSARGHLNAVNVTAKPMADVDATYEFIEQFVEAQVIAMYREVKNNTPLPKTATDMEALLDTIVDTYIIPGMSTTETTDDIFRCNLCGKKYKRINGLRDHIKKKHRENDENDSSNINSNSCFPQLY